MRKLLSIRIFSISDTDSNHNVISTYGNVLMYAVDFIYRDKLDELEVDENS